MAASSPALSNNGILQPPPPPSTLIPLPPQPIRRRITADLTNLSVLNAETSLGPGAPTSHARVVEQKAQNPCHIHVLKGGSNILDKITSSSSPITDHQSTNVSYSGNSHRVASLRQLSNTFAQFNNLQTPVRSRKPLTRKEAQVINE